jgi:phosphinothricin acetyltransferase
MSPCNIRPATIADLPVINDIYNFHVLNSTCTYQEEPETIESRRAWFEKHSQRHPVIVAEMDGRVVGWGSLNNYHSRSAYRFTVSNSVYVRNDLHRRGVGSAILADLLERARQLGYRNVMAAIDGDQLASINLHARFGFEKVSHLKKVGFKFGRWLDVVDMQWVNPDASQDRA